MRSKKIFYSILIFVVSIGLFSSCSYKDNQLSQKHNKSIVLKGNSVISIKPDTAILTLGLSIDDEDINKIKIETNKIINNILDSEVKLGVDRKDMYISNYFLDPMDNLYYNLYSEITLKTKDINKIGEILTKATNEAAKFGIDLGINLEEFTVNDCDKYYKEALNNAIEDGNNKAKALSKSLGVDLGSAIKIDENQNYSNNNENDEFTNAFYDKKSNSIRGANKLIKASVNMTFEY